MNDRCEQQMRMDERGVVLGPQFDRIEKRWGWEQTLVETEHYAVKHLLMRRDQTCSLHWHDRKHETVTCLSGTLVIEFENHPAVTLFPGFSLAIPAGRVHAHRMLAAGEMNCRYLEASAAGCRDDATRVTIDTPTNP
jgi:mannose-6-phosphate isomerase-like protein (cupin superfamily)